MFSFFFSPLTDKWCSNCRKLYVNRDISTRWHGSSLNGKQSFYLNIFDKFFCFMYSNIFVFVIELLQNFIRHDKGYFKWQTSKLIDIQEIFFDKYNEINVKVNVKVIEMMLDSPMRQIKRILQFRWGHRK